MNDLNFENVFTADVDLELYADQVKHLERMMTFLSDSIEQLKAVEKPQKAHSILVRLTSDKLVEAIQQLN